MGPLVVIVMSISAGLMVITAASAGIYYVYKSKKYRERRSMLQITSTPAHAHEDPYLEDSVLEVEKVPVQPETRRPIRSSQDVYPPIRDEDPDPYGINLIDCSPGAMASDDSIEKRGYLEITLHYYQLSSTLTVTLIRMGDLPKRDTGHPPDVLVEMQIRYAYADKIKSETYQANCNPHMYESFRFEIPQNDLGNQTLFFNVIDMMETNLPPPPTPPEMPKSRWGKTPEPPPPPPPPSPTQIGISTVPLVSVAMKKLMSDTELSIIRDVIKIKRKPVVPSAPLSSAAVPESAVPTTEDLVELTEEEKEEDAELEEVSTLTTSSTMASFRLEDEPPSFGACILVSLAYWKPSEKLTVVVMKAKNLSLPDKTKVPDAFVKLCVKLGDKKLKKKRTVVKRSNRNPVWNEAFSFAVPQRILHRVSLHCSVKNHSDRGRERSLGILVLGSRSSEEDVVDHWNAMNASSKSVAKWHLLEEERDLSRRSSKASVKAVKEARRASKGSVKGSKKTGTAESQSDTATPGAALPDAETESQPAQAPQTE